MLITTTDIQLFQILKQKLGEKEAEALVSYVEAKLRDNNEQNLKVLATKEDIAELKEDNAKVRIEMSKMEARLTMRMFYFWLGQIAVIGGILAYFFKTH